jgi:hypothetical protein
MASGQGGQRQTATDTETEVRGMAGHVNESSDFLEPESVIAVLRGRAV